MNQAAVADLNLIPDTVAERRRHPRVAGPLRARVRGVNALGKRFTEDAEVKDLSGGGLYVIVAERVERGARLVAENLLASRGTCGVTAAGEVVRVEPLIDGRCGAAVAFTWHDPD